MLIVHGAMVNLTYFDPYELLLHVGNILFGHDLLGCCSSHFVGISKSVLFTTHIFLCQLMMLCTVHSFICILYSTCSFTCTLVMYPVFQQNFTVM